MLVYVPFTRPNRKSAASLPSTSVTRLLAIDPVGSSCTVNCASTAAKPARSAAASPVTSPGAGAEVPVRSAFHSR